MPTARIRSIADTPGHSEVEPVVRELLIQSLRALPHMYLAETHEFAQTARRDATALGGLRAEGTNLRYAAIAALGIAQLDDHGQRRILDGISAQQLIHTLSARGLAAPDLGSAALVGWATAEVCGVAPEALFARIVADAGERTIARPTVDFAWTVTALIAARGLGDFADATTQAVDRLLAGQSDSGIFPHALPRTSLGRIRSHVACFADQVYPIQALARYYAMTGEKRALEAANRCAAAITELQGTAGQWWWHYDVRTGGVVEKYPVYSVHQHAMAPMALQELREAGGDDHRAAVALGLSWLESHPESTRPLCDDETGAVWRKIGLHEPFKAARWLRAASTALSPQFTLGSLDRIFRPGFVDHECRPYELGWLLYAWLARPIVDILATPSGDDHE